MVINEVTMYGSSTAYVTGMGESMANTKWPCDEFSASAGIFRDPLLWNIESKTSA
jgi:hypothetical protein